MKTIGIQIKSNEAILVVLALDQDGNVKQLSESTKFKIDDPTNQDQVKQFKNQINTFFDAVKATRIGIVARNHNGKGKMAPSPTSFKLEGIIQLYEKNSIEIIWKKTTDAFLNKNLKQIEAEKMYQVDAFDLAYYLIKN